MNEKKGRCGYLAYYKKIMLLKAAMQFFVVIALLVIGYVYTGSKSNIMTVFAIVCCLPAVRTLVGVLVVLPYKGFREEQAKTFDQNMSRLLKMYDVILTSKEHIMPMDCVLVSRNLVCAHAISPKTSIRELEMHIKDTLKECGHSIDTVTVFHDYHPFVKCAEELEKKLKEKNEQAGEQEKAVANTLKSLSI